MTDEFDLPKDWEAAQPIVAAFMSGSHARRNEIDTKIDGLKDHIDDKFSGLHRIMTETVETQRDHAETLRGHAGELGRLHDQQINVIAANNALLTNFGAILGDLSNRVHKGEYVSAIMLFGMFLGLAVLFAVAWKLWS